MDTKITIVTVNYNTADYIDLMLYSFKKLTFNRYKVIICDNGSTDSELIKLIKVVQKYDNVELMFRKQSVAGSVGHAEAMDLLVRKIDTKYFVTMDSDAVFLLKNWDQQLITRIDEKTKVIGTTVPARAGIRKNLDFPSVFAVLYETALFKNLNPSFMPGEVRGAAVKQDTGWMIRDAYLNNGFNGELFDSINTRYISNDVFKDVICAVYFLNDQMIASHFGRGSSGGISKYDKKWWSKIPFLSKIIRRIVANIEKKRWIQKCIGVIDSEVKK